jgi:hypothetical protein
MEEEKLSKRRQIRFVFLIIWVSLLECQLLASATLLTLVGCLPDMMKHLFLLHVNIT